MTRQDHRFSAEAFLSDRHEHDKVVWLDRRIERHNANAERDLLRWAMTRGRIDLARRADIHAAVPTRGIIDRLCGAGLICRLPLWSRECFVVTAWGAIVCARGGAQRHGMQRDTA